jgi:K+-sensing histidine kinase KdpD
MTDLPIENRSDAVSWADIVGFVRQLSHDLRNHLNAAELQAAYLSELVESEELKTEVRRLREMMREVATALQRVGAAMAPVKPTLMPYRAVDFLQDLKAKANLMRDPAKVTWETEPGNAMLNIDPQLLQQAALELFENAFRHKGEDGPIVAKAYVENGKFIFALREPKTRFELPTEKWGREPLRRISRGHYGLGLSRVRAIVEAHSGEFEARYDPATSELATTLRLPLAKKENLE